MRILAATALGLCLLGAPVRAALVCESVKSNTNGNGDRYLGTAPGVADAVSGGVRRAG